MNNGVVVGAIGTGEGKTTVALALTHLLARRGAAIVPFKIGPDYIDARLYEAACGRRAHNLDLWLDGAAGVKRHVERVAGGAPIVLEGMMGLFDGDDEGETSTAHVAALLDLPVILVIDLWRMSQSAAAIAIGCAQMQPRVRIAGVILNRTGGASHERAVRRALAGVGVAVLAALPFRERWKVAERHLGLEAERSDALQEIAADAADLLEGQLDLGSLFDVTAHAPRHEEKAQNGVPIAVARDEAFWFTYPETLEALHDAGALLTEFSPLHDRALPANTRGVWIGGGYPELHAAALAENRTMRRSIADAVAAGVPVYAECGGMMYLAQEVKTRDGAFAMSAALKGSTSIAQPRLQIGYRKAQALQDSLMDRTGDAVRAYEFHYASGEIDESPAYECADQRVGAWRPNVLASFFHRHFVPGDSSIARFLEHCRAGSPR